MAVKRIPGADPTLERWIATRGLEAGAEGYLQELRWPDGTVCPRCDSDRIGYIATRSKHECRDCRYQFRVTAGTVLHDSHVPASTWLLAVGLLLDAENGFPATRLHKAIGGSYKTAWFIEHRIRSAMAQALHALEPAIAVACASREEAHGTRSESQDVPPAPDEVRAGLRLIKSLAAGAYHRPSEQHLSAYWAELRWRDEHAGNDDAFRRTVEALLAADPLTYTELVGRN